MDRASQLLADIDLGGTGLEIGPLDKPLVARVPGRRIFYADYAPREKLQSKSANDPNVNTEAIPHIDFIIETLDDYAAISERFDYIVASHVIEHVPDFVGWLERLLAVLQPSGRLVLAIPDKRYTFDYFRSVSTLGDALESYFEKRRRPTFRQVFDGHGEARRVTPAMAWDGPVSDAEPYFEQQTVLQWAKDALFNGAYSDCHCWVFTFASFLEMLRGLNDLNVLSAQIVKAIPPQPYTNEFYVTLSREEAFSYEGHLVRRPGSTPEDAKVYVVQNGQRRWVTSVDEIRKLGYKWPGDVKEIPAAELEAIPSGEPIQ